MPLSGCPADIEFHGTSERERKRKRRNKGIMTFAFLAQQHEHFYRNIPQQRYFAQEKFVCYSHNPMGM
jgi:hypothetical protein